MLISAGFVSCNREKKQIQDGTVLKEPGIPYDTGNGISFQYTFDRVPAMGMNILKIVLLQDGNKPSGPVKITGDVGMPDMKGSHDSGEMEFRVNNRGEYLLPVNIVMPGKWHAAIRFYRDGKIIFTAFVEIDV